jgi:hypothetical protein
VTLALRQRVSDGAAGRSFEWKASVYLHRRVLVQLQGAKCCQCQSLFTGAPGSIQHYRWFLNVLEVTRENRKRVLERGRGGQGGGGGGGSVSTPHFGQTLPFPSVQTAKGLSARSFEKIISINKPHFPNTHQPWQPNVLTAKSTLHVVS